MSKISDKDPMERYKVFLDEETIDWDSFEVVGKSFKVTVKIT